VIEEKLNLYVRDILEAAEKAVFYSEGLSYSTFLTDTRTQQAIAMNFVIIGECVARIIQSYPEFAAGRGDIPWIKMRGMRNQVAHGYSDINLEMVWDTVKNSLPELISKLGDKEG
jgi:uncharacterized protein with HEPN domain